MYILRIACILALASPVLAAEPPRPVNTPAVKKLYGLHTPSGWILDVHDDGSGSLGFGASLGDPFPAGTFKSAAVRKALDDAKLDPKGGGGSHYVFWYEEERKAPDDGPPARYTQDEQVIVPLFEKAAETVKLRTEDRISTSLGKKRPGFGLKK